MNTRPVTALTGGLVGLALLLSACVDPAGKFNDFVDRAPDAAPTPDAEILSNIPDVSGRFLFSLSSVVDVDSPFYFIATNTLHPTMGGSATITTSLQPLDYLKRTPVGDPIDFETEPVSLTGQFELTATNVSLPGAANPFSDSTVELSQVTIKPTIKNPNLYCGEVTGMLTSPLMLDIAGSTMGAVRITGASDGSGGMPDPVSRCPADPQN